MTPWGRQLTEMRQRWAARTDADRSISPFVQPPKWAKKTPSLVSPRSQWPTFQAHSEVVLGLCLMANDLLREAQSEQAPGRWVWSRDPDIERDPELLHIASRWFWEVREGNPDVPGLRGFAERALDDALLPDRLELPHLVTAGRVCFESTVLIDPAQLPSDRLGPPILPILVSNDPTVAGAAQLPLAFYPPAVLENW